MTDNEEKIVTISTHNGSAYRREHNKRNPSVVAKEDHIRADGTFEIWKDESAKEAYKRIFGKAVEEYNEKQTKPERKISSYYKKIEEDEKKHTVYEMIIGVYGKDEQGKPICSKEDGKTILRTFVDTWPKRNPSLEMIGAYYHDDEEGEPHVHIDYIPVATGYSVGPSVQSSISKALQNQGFTRQGRQTEQILWEARENQYFGALCAAKGLTVAHPGGKAEHLNTEIFKKTRELEALKRETKELEAAQEAAREQLLYTEDELQTVKDRVALSKAVQEAYKEPEHRIEVLEEYPEKKTLGGKIQPAAVKISRDDFDDLKRRAMASDWIKRALQDLRSLGERLFKAMNQRERVAQLKKQAEDARAHEAEANAKMEILKTECRQKDEHIEDIAVFFEEENLLNRFVSWAARFRERKEREIDEIDRSDNIERE